MAKVRFCTSIEYIFAATVILVHWIEYKQLKIITDEPGFRRFAYFYLFGVYMYTLGLPTLAVVLRSRVLMAVTVLCMVLVLLMTISDIRRTYFKAWNFLCFVYAITMTILAVDLCLFYEQESIERYAQNEMYMNESV